ncbi:hypothetical protein HZB90_04020 [archaeon]|nr:hypothetical protein [archaeon]
MAKKEEQAKHKPHPIEKEAKAAEQPECKVAHPLACPFYTKEGLILIAAAIILIAINNQYTKYAAWACLVAAFFVPMIKGLLKKKE